MLATLATALSLGACVCNNGIASECAGRDTGCAVQNIAGGATITFIHDGAPAWLDVRGSELRNVPPHMSGGLLDVPLHTLAANSPIRYACPPTGKTCDAYVLIYECAQCQSERGGLPAFLALHGWERTRCAPDFVTGVSGGANHRMTSFRKPVLSGQQETFFTPGPVEWSAFVLHRGPSTDCATFNNPTDCHDNELLDFCRWQGSCRTNNCIGRGPGGLTCGVCVRDEWVPAVPVP